MLLTLAVVPTFAGPGGADTGLLPALDDLPRIRTDVDTRFDHAGWPFDRYPDMPTLKAGTELVLADIKGPGIIRHIHTTRHHPAEVLARGIVLEVYFDGAREPAVMCPLADFFGDGCNGKAMYFSTPLIECAPWSYNCYFPMPFRKSARVILRNDTESDTVGYAYVEWEPLPHWSDDLGYFHATYQRREFTLDKEAHLPLFSVKGSGHVIGRQMSIVTREPLFRDFGYVMEGNNEIAIDGVEQVLDYLGTEDSFTFSWGFQSEFAGLRAGMPHVETGDVNELSIYRFHDHMPIRFRKGLTWEINWRTEQGIINSADVAKAAAEGGAKVDCAWVVYWYQDRPGGYRHEPLRPWRERDYVADVDIVGLTEALDVDPDLTNTFATEADLARVATAGTWTDTHPFWIDEPAEVGGHPGNPNPGRRGILATHPQSALAPAYVVRKVRIPDDDAPKLQIVVSGDPYEAPGRSDFVLKVAIVHGGQASWLAEEVIEAGTPASADNWRTLTYDLTAYAGEVAGIALEVSYGGPGGVYNDEAFFDEISVVGDVSSQ